MPTIEIPGDFIVKIIFSEFKSSRTEEYKALIQVNIIIIN